MGIKSAAEKLQNFSQKTTKVSNNVYEVIQSSIGSIDAMVSFISNSPSAQPESLKTVKTATKNIHKVISAISGSITDLVTTLAELQVNNMNAVMDAGSIFMISSIKMAINASSGDQFKGPSLIIASYAKLIALVAELSEYAQKIDSKAIGKSSAATALVFDYLYNTQRKIGRQANRLIKLKAPQLIDKFFEYTRHTIDQIIQTLISLGGVMTEFDKIGGYSARKKTRRAIKTIFSIYIDTLVGSIHLGELLFTGKLTRSYLIPKMFRTKTYGIGNILKGMVALITLTKYFNTVFKMLPPIVEQLVYIGQNKKFIQRGLQAFWMILFGSMGRITGVHGLIEITTSDKKIDASGVGSAITTVLILKYFGLIFNLLKPVVDSLVYIGTNIKQIKYGLLATELILSGTRFQKGLIQILSSVKSKDLAKVSRIVSVVATLSLIMIIMLPTFASLNFAGKNYRSIKRGLKSVELILLGSSGIFGLGKKKSLIQILSSITKKDFNSVVKSIKTIVVLTLVSVLLNILTLNIAAIGRRKRFIQRGIDAISYLNNLINIIAKINVTIKKKKVTSKMVFDITKILLPLAFLLAAISVALTIIGMNVIGITLSIVSLLLIRVVLIEIVWIANYLKRKGKNLAKTTAIFTTIGTLLRTMAKVFMMFITASLTLALIGLATASMLAVITGMTLVLLAILMLSKLPTLKISMTLGTLVAMSVVLFTLAFVFTRISKAVEDLNILSILVFVGCIAAFLGIFALIGLATPVLSVALMGVGMFTLLSLGLMVILIPIQRIADMGASTFEKAKENTRLLLETCFDIIRSFINASSEFLGIKTNNPFAKFVLSIVGTASAIVEVILAFAFISLTFVTVSLLLLTARMLSEIAEIDMSVFYSAKDKVGLIMETVGQIIDAITKKPDKNTDTAGEKKSTFRKILEFAGGPFKKIKGIIDAILSFGYVAFVMVMVSLIDNIAKNLEYIGKLELDPNTITTKVTLIMDTAAMVINKLNEEKSDKSELKKDRKRTEIIKDTIRKVKHIAEHLDEISKFNLKSETLNGKVQTILDAAGLIINSDVLNNNLKTLRQKRKAAEITKDILRKIKKGAGFINDIAGTNTKGVKGVINAYGGFIDKISEAKLENLETATRMFEKMAEFSRSISGNFEGLADVLNEKIMPLLEELNSNISDTSKTVQNQSALSPGQPSIISPAAITNTSGSQGNVKVVDYTATINQIKEEIAKLRSAMTDGSQIVVVDTR